jgi:hypothetical protein
MNYFRALSFFLLSAALLSNGCKFNQSSSLSDSERNISIPEGDYPLVTCTSSDQGKPDTVVALVRLGKPDRIFITRNSKLVGEEFQFESTLLGRRSNMTYNSDACAGFVVSEYSRAMHLLKMPERSIQESCSLEGKQNSTPPRPNVKGPSNETGNDTRNESVNPYDQWRTDLDALQKDKVYYIEFAKVIDPKKMNEPGCDYVYLNVGIGKMTDPRPFAGLEAGHNNFGPRSGHKCKIDWKNVKNVFSAER